MSVGGAVGQRATRAVTSGSVVGSGRAVSWRVSGGPAGSGPAAGWTRAGWTRWADWEGGPTGKGPAAAGGSVGRGPTGRQVSGGPAGSGPVVGRRRQVGRQRRMVAEMAVGCDLERLQRAFSSSIEPPRARGRIAPAPRSSQWKWPLTNNRQQLHGKLPILLPHRKPNPPPTHQPHVNLPAALTKLVDRRRNRVLTPQIGLQVDDRRHTPAGGQITGQRLESSVDLRPGRFDDLHRSVVPEVATGPQHTQAVPREQIINGHPTTLLREKGFQFRRSDLVQLRVRTGLRGAVRAEPHQSGSVAESPSLYVLVTHLSHPLGP